MYKKSTFLHKTSDEFHQDDHIFMKAALALAEQGADLGEVPVGAVMVYNQAIIAQGFNCPITSKDSSAHAEMVVLKKACEFFDNYRLPKGCTLYITLEPCTMCLGAIIHARVDRVVFGAFEPKAGAIISQENFVGKSYFNHYLNIEGGLLSEQSKVLLQTFFKHRRDLNKKH